MKLDKRGTAIDSSKFNGVHIKMVHFKKKSYLEDMIGTLEKERPIDTSQIIEINDITNTTENDKNNEKWR